MSYAGSRVLITGGLGLIGSSLARSLLLAGADVAVIDNLDSLYGGNLANIDDIAHGLSLHIGDVRDEALMRTLLSGKDYIFNLAAQTSHVGSMQDPKSDLEINVVSQLSLLEECRRFCPNAKIVFASTRQIYGKPDYLPVDEAHPVRPPDVNGVNKLAAESYHILYNEVYGLKSCVLRLTNTYGPGMRIKDARQTFLGIWVRRILEGQPIQVFGNGLQLRDFNYVDDCVVALLAAGLNDATNGRVFNLGGAEPIGLKVLADKIIAAAGGGEIEIVPFPPERKAIDIGDFYGDYRLFARTCGWVPAIDLDEGIRRTLAYYRRNSERYL